MKPPKPFTYYGVPVRALTPNPAGLRYETSILADIPHMRTDTKEGMKEHIRESIPASKRRRSRQ